MAKVFIQGLVIILLWVGAWGILEMSVDNIAGDNRQVRFATYFIFIILGVLLFWIIQIAMPDDDEEEEI